MTRLSLCGLEPVGDEDFEDFDGTTTLKDDDFRFLGVILRSVGDSVLCVGSF